MDENESGAGDQQAVRGAMSGLYDVFVDWKGRLEREMPGLLSHLEAAGAKRVLDVGCGTGRHVRALREAGFDAHGADPSPDMLAQAREHVGEPERLHDWRMGEEPGESLAAAAPFDALIAMGNTWALVHREEDARRAVRAWRALVRPGGLVLLGLKAVGVREESGNPYLPLLKREKDGRPLWFVRFVDFAVPPLDDGTRIADLHMVVVAGDERAGGASEALFHRTSRLRVWTPASLGEWLEKAGLVEVRVSGRLDDPEAPAPGEDVFARAFLAPRKA